MRIAVLAIPFCVAACSTAEPRMAPNAPPDNPVRAPHAELETATAPYVARAKATYPLARDRFLRGLPQGELFFVTTPLAENNYREVVFVLVSRIEGSQIVGRIASRINLVKGFRSGDTYQFPESALLDWTITKPDGSEEGNVVGKFLDTYRRK